MATEMSQEELRRVEVHSKGQVAATHLPRAKCWGAKGARPHQHRVPRPRPGLAGNPGAPPAGCVRNQSGGEAGQRVVGETEVSAARESPVARGCSPNDAEAGVPRDVAVAKTGDAVGRTNQLASLLEPPSTKFFCEKLRLSAEKEKSSKTERNGSLVETDAADGNPLTTRIPTAAWKAQNAFHRSHKADDDGPITS